MFRHGGVDDPGNLDAFMRSLGHDFAKDLDPGAVETRTGDTESLREFTQGTDEAEGFMTTLLSYDPYDARIFRELYEASKDLRELSEDPKAPKTFGPLLMDLFLMYFKVTPTTIPASGVEPGHLRANGPFMGRILAEEDTMITRISTCLDELLAAQATIEAGRAFLEELNNRPELKDWAEEQAKPREDDPEPPEGEERQERHATASSGDGDDIDQKAQPAKALGGDQQPQGPPRDQGPEAPEEEDSGAEDEIGVTARDDEGEESTDEEAAVVGGDGVDLGQAPQGPPPPPQHLTAAVRAAAGAGHQEARELLRAISAWGFEPGDLKRVPLGERIELAKKLRTRRLRDLAAMLGRMKNTKRATQKKKLRSDNGEKHSVTISGVLERTLPSERASAFGSGDEYRELDFYRKLSEKKVPSHDLRIVENMGHGPVIAMIDASYSMSGERMEWASSLALALAHPGTKRPAKGDRHLYAIFFNTRIVLEVELEPGEADLQKLVSVGTVAPGGGTRYTEPMKRALEVASDLEGRQPKRGGNRNRRGRTVPKSSRRESSAASRGAAKTPADFLLITDGECRLDKEFTEHLLEEKRRRGFRIVSVLIGGDTRKGGSLKPFSDLVIPVAYLGGSSCDEAAKIFHALDDSGGPGIPTP